MYVICYHLCVDAIVMALPEVIHVLRLNILPVNSMCRPVYVTYSNRDFVQMPLLSFHSIFQLFADEQHALILHEIKATVLISAKQLNTGLQFKERFR